MYSKYIITLTKTNATGTINYSRTLYFDYIDRILVFLMKYKNKTNSYYRIKNTETDKTIVIYGKDLKAKSPIEIGIHFLNKLIE